MQKTHQSIEIDPLALSVEKMTQTPDVMQNVASTSGAEDVQVLDEQIVVSPNTAMNNAAALLAGSGSGMNEVITATMRQTFIRTQNQRTPNSLTTHVGGSASKCFLYSISIVFWQKKYNGFVFLFRYSPRHTSWPEH